METEKRSMTRVPVSIEVFIHNRGERIAVKTWNLSLRGMQCTPDDRFREGDPCRVVLVLSKQVHIEIESKVTRRNERETGIYFENMDADSFFHLKRLVQMNAEDADKIDTELTAPVDED